MKHESSDIEVVDYHSSMAEAWNRVVRLSRNGTFLHLREYMDYHSDRFVDGSLVVMRKGIPAAVLPASRHGSRVISHGGLTYGGLVYGADVKVGEVLSAFRGMQDYFVAAGVEDLIYKAVPHVFHRSPAEEDLFALSRSGANLVRRDLSSVINLRHRLKLSDSRKSIARRPFKAGAEVSELQDLDEFHRLLSVVLARHSRSPVHSLEELVLLRSRFPKHIRAFGMIKAGVLLAGALLYDFEHVVHTQYLASSDEGREVGALDGLLMHLIDTVFPAREHFSFGISTENEGRDLNEGLVRQKEGFGARAIVHDFYRWVFTS